MRYFSEIRRVLKLGWVVPNEVVDNDFIVIVEYETYNMPCGERNDANILGLGLGLRLGLVVLIISMVIVETAIAMNERAYLI